MKVPFCLILFFVASLQDLSSQTTYFFLNSATDPSSVNSWTTDPSGVLLLSPPTDFTNPADVFNLDNSITLSSDWTVAGEMRVDVGISESGDPELDIGTLVVKSGGSLDLRIIDPRPVLDTLKIEVGGMVLTCNLEVSSSVVVNGLLHMASLCDITGSASFTLNAGDELKTNDPLNLTSNAGAIQVTGTRSYSSEADYTFRTSGLASYSTGDGLPSQVNNLEITFSNNDPSTVTLSQDVTVNGTFKLTNDPGTFDIGSNILVTNGTISFDDGATLGTSSGSAWTIAGTGPEVALPAMTLDGTITISRPNGARLDGVVNILGSMVLDGGDVDLNGEILNLGSSGLLNESAGNTVKGTSGTVFAQRMLNAPQAVNVAGMGITITSDADLGTTNISRAHAEQTVISNASMLRYFDVTPTNNSGLNADLVFSYDDSELNSLNEANIVLFRSTDGGTNWIQRGGTANAANNTISLSGIDAFSRWTASVPPVLFRVERSTGDVFTGGAFLTVPT